ncbi:hypothetical protein FMUAM8_13000 [Nocardia cyriacigeorgica]|nr:hypothetical protein FMUAM8_13000 [Nocardia cyriacigeorgica]
MAAPDVTPTSRGPVPVEVNRGQIATISAPITTTAMTNHRDADRTSDSFFTVGQKQDQSTTQRSIRLLAAQSLWSTSATGLPRYAFASRRIRSDLDAVRAER